MRALAGELHRRGETLLGQAAGLLLAFQERRALLDWTIRPALRTIPGVADVNALGGRVRTYEVVPDRAALAAAGVTLAELAAALETNNQNDGAGRLRDGEEALVVRATAAYGGLDDVASVVVARQGGRVLRVADLAQVRYPYGASEHDAREKLGYDLYYVSNHSLVFDFMILLQTVEIVLFRIGSR